MPAIDSTKLNKKPFVIGVAGGSGSGKTYFARQVQLALGKHQCELIYQDNFYKDQSGKFDKDGGSVNFDHPDSLDLDLLAEHLKTLKTGKSTNIPTYDFTTHQRLKQTVRIEPRPVILVDGILIFHPANLRELFDLRIFFDTPMDLCFQRRLERDIAERGRTAEGVRNQFQKQVKPMFDKFVEPSKVSAHEIITESLWDQAFLTGFLEKHKLK